MLTENMQSEKTVHEVSVLGSTAGPASIYSH